MQPLPLNSPVIWGEQEPRVSHMAVARVPRADFERRWGPSHWRSERADGAGPTASWGWRAECGLLLVVSFEERTGAFHVTVREDELDHALAHLDWWRGEVVWRLDEGTPRPSDGWAVYRQDDTGNLHDVCVMRNRAHAECLARRLESRAHKQWYSVEARGSAVTGRDAPVREL